MAEGQLLGPRKWYIYTLDDGTQQVVLLIDETLGDLAGTGLVEANTTTAAGLNVNPRKFKPRVMFWQKDGTGQRKEIVCGTKDASLYETASATALTIDGDAGTITGRRGEKVSYPLVPAPPPP